jgi:hypothetical protein
MAEINRQRVQENYTPWSSVTNPSRASDFVILNTNLSTSNRGDATTGVFAEAIWDADLTPGAANHTNMIAVDVPVDARVFVPFWIATATATSIDGSAPCAITQIATTASTGAGKVQIYGSVPVSSQFNKALPSSIVTNAAPNYQPSVTVPVMGLYLAAGTTIAQYSASTGAPTGQVSMFNQYLDGTDGGVVTTIAPVTFHTSTLTSWGYVANTTATGTSGLSVPNPCGIPVNGLTRITCAVVDAFGFTLTVSDANNTGATVSNARVMLGGFFAG